MYRLACKHLRQQWGSSGGGRAGSAGVYLLAVASMGGAAVSFESSSKQHCYCEQHKGHPAIGNVSHNHEEAVSTSNNVNKPQDSSSFRLKDEYDVEKVLGEGAYGLVYKARRKSDGVSVALKAMPRELTGKTDFEREVAALQLLSKPPNGPNSHVVQLYDLHRDENNYYLAMELIEGGELFEMLIEHGPYSEAVAAKFLRQFAEAICFVHNTGLTHADLKPENLMMEANKMDLKVVDFGCACTHDLGRKEMQLPAQEFAMGCSFLHQAALGNQFELQRILLERPALINFRDYDKRTALHVAASEGHLDLCRYLVGRGAIINRVDRWGGTPLDDAHRHGHTAVLQFLGQRGGTFASTSAKDRSTHFISAASEGDVQEVQALLEFGNIDLNKGDYDRRTALHLAASEGRLAVVKLLCDAGADVNVEDRWGNRPLDDAKNAKTNASSMITLLKNYGAKHSYGGKSSAPKQTDVGTSVQDDSATSGTIAYWSPELFAEGAKPTPAADMWATGIITFILLTGTHPFDKHAIRTDEQIAELLMQVGRKDNDNENLLEQIVFDERIEGLSDSCVSLLRQLLTIDPKKRMTSEDFRRHPWIQGLTASWTTLEKTHAELEAFWHHKFRSEILQKFGALVKTAPNDLTEEDLKTMFNALDIDKSGALELDEIAAVFQHMDDKNIRQLFTYSDLDGSGVIHWDEFRTLMKSRGSANDSGSHKKDSKEDDTQQAGSNSLQVQYMRERFRRDLMRKFSVSAISATDTQQLRSMFNAMDLQGNGFLDAHEIRVLLRSLGEPEDVITKMVASLDVQKVGGVSWTEFQNIMLGADEAHE